MAAFGRSFLQRSHGINGFQPMILQDHPADFADETERDSLPLREMLRLAGGACLDCSDRYSAVEAVYSIALGFRNAPRCLRCVAVRLERTSEDLRRQLLEYVERRECYRRAYREAVRLDGAWPDASVESPLPNVSDRDPTGANSSLFWDAGDIGCGELVMALRLRLCDLPAGQPLTVRATDPAAPEDIPAWCRLTGHTLLSQEHPIYRIESRGTSHAR